jgi:hypothetical protein
LGFRESSPGQQKLKEGLIVEVAKKVSGAAKVLHSQESNRNLSLLLDDLGGLPRLYFFASE